MEGVGFGVVVFDNLALEGATICLSLFDGRRPPVIIRQRGSTDVIGSGRMIPSLRVKAIDRRPGAAIDLSVIAGP